MNINDCVVGYYGNCIIDVCMLNYYHCLHS